MTNSNTSSGLSADSPGLPVLLAEQARRQSLRAASQTAPVDLTLEASRVRCKRLSGFVREAWHVVEPAMPYIHGWHIDAIAEHLEAITFGSFLTLGVPNRLLINVPPGMMKSLLTSVFWQAWEWGPMGLTSMRYFTTSYHEAYATRDARRTRDLILSDWYQERWGTHVQLTRTGETSFANSSGGWREAVPFNRLTGGRGDRVVIDDPHSTEEAESEADRKRALRVFHESLPSRMNDPVRSAIAIIMQRLNVEDVAGAAIKTGLYQHLMLPMEFEPDRRCETIIGFRDPRTKADELLFPERFPRDVVERDKKVMGSFAVAGQFQQRPTQREGGLFKRRWFEIIGAAPAGTRWVRYWDLAATKQKLGNDPPYTAGCKLGMTPDGLLIIGDMERFRDDGVEVRKSVRYIAIDDGPSCVIGLPQDPGQAGKVQAKDYVRMLMGFVVKVLIESGDKVTRAEPIAAQAEAGNVKLVRGAWNEAFLSEANDFPGGKHKDQVDALSGAFTTLLGAASVFTVPAEDFMVSRLRRSGVVAGQGQMLTN